MQNLEPLKQLLGYGADTPDARLKEALTHRSYAVENQIAYDNQRLEFLGDAVLEIALSVHLFQKYPRADEGKLTRMRSVLVRESALAELARHLHLGDYLLVGKGEKEVHGTCRISTLADLFEAVIGAAYLEVGSRETLAMLVKLFDGILPAPDRLIDEVNPKGSLQEFAQARWGEHPEYRLIQVSGPEHLPTFEVEVHLQNYVASGKATGRRAAESAAARELLLMLQAEGVMQK